MQWVSVERIFQSIQIFSLCVVIGQVYNVHERRFTAFVVKFRTLFIATLLTLFGLYVMQRNALCVAMQGENCNSSSSHMVTNIITHWVQIKCKIIINLSIWKKITHLHIKDAYGNIFAVRRICLSYAFGILTFLIHIPPTMMMELTLHQRCPMPLFAQNNYALALLQCWKISYSLD